MVIIIVIIWIRFIVLECAHTTGSVSKGYGERCGCPAQVMPVLGGQSGALATFDVQRGSNELGPFTLRVGSLQCHGIVGGRTGMLVGERLADLIEGEAATALPEAHGCDHGNTHVAVGRKSHFYG